MAVALVVVMAPWLSSSLHCGGCGCGQFGRGVVIIALWWQPQSWLSLPSLVGLGIDYQPLVGVGGRGAWCMWGGRPWNGLVINVSKQKTKKKYERGGKSHCTGVGARRCRCTHRGPVIIVSIQNRTKKTYLVDAGAGCGGGRRRLSSLSSLSVVLVWEWQHRAPTVQIDYGGGVTHQTCLVLWTWRKLADELMQRTHPRSVERLS